MKTIRHYQKTVFFSCMFLFCVSFTLFSPQMLLANETDLGKVSCKQFLEGSKDSKKMMLTWIDGYMSALSKNTVMSEAWMVQLATHMTSYCAKHPVKTILDAIGEMPDEDKSPS